MRRKRHIQTLWGDFNISSSGTNGMKWEQERIEIILSPLEENVEGIWGYLKPLFA